MMRNSYFHEASDPPMCPIPNPMRPPRAIPTPLAVYQYPMMVGCCLRVNHMAVIATLVIKLRYTVVGFVYPQTWIGDGFKHSRDETERKHHLVRCRSGLSHEEHAPEEDVDTEVFCQREFADKSAKKDVRIKCGHTREEDSPVSPMLASLFFSASMSRGYYSGGSPM